MTQPPQAGLFKQLLQRRVFQIVGIYLGAIVALMEFTGIIVERYGFTDRLVDIVLAAMISFLPAVILLAWRHGAPGKDEWGKAEKLGVPANIVVTLALVLSIHLNDSPDTTQVTPSQNLSHNQASALETTKGVAIPRIGIFFFDQLNLNQNDHWLSYGLPYLISNQLTQQKSLIVNSFFNDNLFWMVKRAGFKEGLGLPLSLARSVATDADLNYFVRATLSTTGQSSNQQNFALQLKLFSTESNDPIAEFSVENKDPFELAIAATQFLRQQPQLLPKDDHLIDSIPLKDYITGNLAALQSFVEAAVKIVFDNDYDAAIKGMRQAIEQDPSYALAYISLADLLFKKGEFNEGEELLQKALTFGYKLNEPIKFSIKSWIYATQKKVDEQISVFRSWLELYPQDYEPYNRLANILMQKSENHDEIIALYQRSLELNPTQSWIYSRLGKIYESQKNYSAAIAEYRKHQKLRPKLFTPILNEAEVAIKQGDLESAKKLARRAAFLRTDKVSPVLMLANLALREGRIDDALDRYEEASSISQAPRQRGNIIAHKVNFYYTLGQVEKSFQYLQMHQEVIQQYHQPLDAIFISFISQIHLYVDTNRTQQALDKLESLQQELDEGIVDAIQFGYLFLNLQLNKTEQAKQAFVKVERFVEQYQMKHLEYLVDIAASRIAAQENNHQLAVERLEQALVKYQALSGDAVTSASEGYIHELLIKNLIALKQYDKAQKVANNILKQWPKHPNTHLQLSQIYNEENNKQASLKHLSIAQSIWKNADEFCDWCVKTKSVVNLK